MIRVFINGFEYTNFKRVEVQQSLDEVSGLFTIEAATDGSTPFPIKIDSPCVIEVEGVPFVTGHIDIIDCDYNKSTHNIVMQGRDKTSDLIDSTLGKGVEYNSTISLKGVIELILKETGNSHISVVDLVGNIAEFSTAEKVASEVGTGVFALIESYCRKRQVLITSDGDGNLVLIRGAMANTAYKLFNKIGEDKLNNIKSARVSYNNSGRFNQYNIYSQSNVSLLNETGETSADNIAAATGKATDSDIRTSRVFNVIAEKTSSPSQCEQRAIWQANVNRARAFNYEATIQGHSVNGTPLMLNNLMSVVDDYAGINGDVLINALYFRQDNEEGSITRISMVTKDAYDLIASEPQQQKKTSALGEL